MIDFYKEKEILAGLQSQAEIISAAFGIDLLKEKVKELEKLQNAENFWADPAAAQKVNQELTEASKKIRVAETLNKNLADIADLIDLVEEMQDEGEAAEVRKMLAQAQKECERLGVEALMRGKYDANNAILTLHAGAGGTESQDWVEMLYRMYTRYAEKKGYKLEEIDFLDGDEAGIKRVTFFISGPNAYGYLKAEKGVHRLVRISPFDANKRRHTSFAALEVMPEIIDDAEIIIKPEDLRIDTFRAGGKGGQHVNKTDSAIRITHLPTGIVTQCQNERSQIQNKERAMRMLKSKLAELRENQLLEESNLIKGDVKKIEWGSQIRSYVFCPYTLVKDHRTNYEKGDVNAVMDGEIEEFIIEYLKRGGR
ncbi:MAG: peptide chain release factor 2 [Christensenellales bacterium]